MCIKTGGKDMPNRIALLTIFALGGIMAAQSQPAQNTAPAPAASEPKAATAEDVRDPLLDLPPLPQKRITLIGGTLSRLDHVRDRMVVQVFGGKKMPIHFDVRTHIYFNGTPVADRELKEGQRIYIDTQLNGDKVFAKSVWIETAPVVGDGRGQIIDYDASQQVLTVRDEISSQAMKFQLTPATVVRNANQTIAVGDLKPGSLVSLSFGPPQGRYATVKNISLLAAPGSLFSFFGRITFIDLSRRVVAVQNRVDDKAYEISVSGIPDIILRRLHEGDEVGVSAVFDGRNYTARTLEPAASQADTND
jgi:hypothetical protein